MLNLKIFQRKDFDKYTALIIVGFQGFGNIRILIEIAVTWKKWETMVFNIQRTWINCMKLKWVMKGVYD